MIDLAFKNILACKTRSLLCILAVMVSVYLNGSTATMNNWMYTTMTSELARYMGKIYVQQGGSSYPPFDSSIAETTAQEILAHNDLNVAQSTPLIFVRLARAMMPFMPAQAMVIGVAPGKESALWGRAEPASGVGAFASDERGDVAILGDKAAGYFSARVGDDIPINNTPVRVIGILQKSSMDSVNIAAVVPLASAQRIFAKEGTVSAVLVGAQDVNNVPTIADTLKRDYPLLQVVTQDDMLKDAQAVLKMPMLYMSVMSLTAFVVAFAVIMSTMVMAVFERTREIGTLRAIGADARTILVTVFAEIVILTLVGGIPGAILTLPMATVMNTILPSPAQFAQIVLLAVVAGALGGLYPAWRAARVNPLEALRYE
jgi:putative ABC transport system permease protein